MPLFALKQTVPGPGGSHQDITQALAKISGFKGKDFSFERLKQKILSLLAYQGESQDIVRRAVYQAVQGMSEAVAGGDHGRVLGLAGEISGLYEVVIKIGTTLEQISLGRLETVDGIVYGDPGVVKEFDAISSNTVFEFKFHLTLRKLYQQVIGIDSASQPHLKMLTDYPEFAQIRNIVYFGEADEGYVVEAINSFIRNRPRIISRVTVTEKGGVAVKFTLSEIKEFLCADSTVALARQEEKKQGVEFLPRDFQQSHGALEELINRKITKLAGEKFDLIVAVSNISQQQLESIRGMLNEYSALEQDVALLTDNHAGYAELLAARKQYLDLIRNTVNPGLDKTRVFYLGSAADISTALLATAGKLFIFADSLNYRPQEEFTAAEEARRKHSYLLEKGLLGWTRSEMLDIDIGCARYPLKWELESLGARIRTEKKMEAKGPVYEITFTLAGQSRERKIIYFEVADARDEWRYPAALISQLQQGVDFCIIKAFPNIRLSWGANALILENLNKGGVIITDNGRSWSGYPAELEEIEPEEMRDYESKNHTQFGYYPVRLFRKKTAGSQVSANLTIKDNILAQLETPKTGRELILSLGISDLEAIVPVYQVCNLYPRITIISAGEKYLRMDRMEGEMFPRLSPAILRSFLDYEVIGKTGYPQVDEYANELEQKILGISASKERLARRWMQEACASLHLGKGVVFIISGDVVMGMSHDTARAERSTGIIVDGSDLDVTVIIDDQSAVFERLAEIDEKLYQIKWRMLRVTHAELDYQIKPLSQIRGYKKKMSPQDTIAVKILLESKFLCGGQELYAEIKSMLEDSRWPEILRSHLIAAQKRRARLTPEILKLPMLAWSRELYREFVGEEEEVFSEPQFFAISQPESDISKKQAQGDSQIIVGVPKEIKAQEGRVGLTPAGVKLLVKNGTVKVIVESQAGAGSGFSDQGYIKAGAEIVQTAPEVWQRADLIKKVKEPLPQECPLIRPAQIIFTYLHLADNRDLTECLMKSGCVAIAYETVLKDSQTPLLAPMSTVAGVLGAYQAAFYAAKSISQEVFNDLLNGLNADNFFQRPAIDLNGKNAVVLGGGTVGENCGLILAKAGAEVYLSEINPQKAGKLKDRFQEEGLRVEILNPDAQDLTPYLKKADIIVGAVYILGKLAPILIDKDKLLEISQDKKKIIVDIAIDQGGNIYGSRATTHQEPTYLDEFGNLRYCVANMPGRVPWVSSKMLEKATLPYLEALALKGLNATEDFPELQSGINVIQGKIVHQGVAESLGLPFSEVPRQKREEKGEDGLVFRQWEKKPLALAKGRFGELAESPAPDAILAKNQAGLDLATDYVAKINSKLNAAKRKLLAENFFREDDFDILVTVIFPAYKSATFQTARDNKYQIFLDWRCFANEELLYLALKHELTDIKLEAIFPGIDCALRELFTLITVNIDGMIKLRNEHPRMAKALLEDLRRVANTRIGLFPLYEKILNNPALNDPFAFIQEICRMLVEEPVYFPNVREKARELREEYRLSVNILKARLHSMNKTFFESGWITADEELWPLSHFKGRIPVALRPFMPYAGDIRYRIDGGNIFLKVRFRDEEGRIKYAHLYLGQEDNLDLTLGRGGKIFSLTYEKWQKENPGFFQYRYAEMAKERREEWGRLIRLPLTQLIGRINRYNLAFGRREIKQQLEGLFRDLFTELGLGVSLSQKTWLGLERQIGNERGPGVYYIIRKRFINDYLDNIFPKLLLGDIDVTTAAIRELSLWPVTANSNMQSALVSWLRNNQVRGPPSFYLQADKISISRLLDLLSRSVPQQQSLFPGEVLPYPLVASFVSQNQAVQAFGRRWTCGAFTLKDLRKGNFPGYIPARQTEIFLERLNELLEIITKTGPPGLAAQFKEALSRVRFYFSNDPANLEEDPQTGLPYVASAIIPSQESYYHVVEFFKQSPAQQSKIIYHELGSHIAQGIKKEAKAMEDTQEFFRVVSLEGPARPVGEIYAFLNRFYYQTKGARVLADFDTVVSCDPLLPQVDAKEFYRHLLSLDEQGRLPGRIVVVEIGIGNARNAINFIRAFKRLDEEYQRSYFARLQYWLCDFSEQMLIDAQSIPVFTGELSGVAAFLHLDALSEPPFTKGEVMLYRHNELYDDLPGQVIIEKREGKLFEVYGSLRVKRDAAITDSAGRLIPPEQFKEEYWFNPEKLSQLQESYVGDIEVIEELCPLDLEAMLSGYADLYKNAVLAVLDEALGVVSNGRIPVNMGAVMNLVNYLTILYDYGYLEFYDYGFKSMADYADVLSGEKVQMRRFGLNATVDVNFELLKKLAEGLGFRVELDRQYEHLSLVSQQKMLELRRFMKNNLVNRNLLRILAGLSLGPAVDEGMVEVITETLTRLFDETNLAHKFWVGEKEIREQLAVLKLSETQIKSLLDRLFRYQDEKSWLSPYMHMRIARPAVEIEEAGQDKAQPPVFNEGAYDDAVIRGDSRDTFTANIQAAEDGLGRLINRVAITEEEREVIILLSNGYSYKRIMASLGISQNRLKLTIQELFQKFGVINPKPYYRRRELLGRLKQREDLEISGIPLSNSEKYLLRLFAVGYWQIPEIEVLTILSFRGVWKKIDALVKRSGLVTESRGQAKVLELVEHLKKHGHLPSTFPVKGLRARVRLNLRTRDIEILRLIATGASNKDIANSTGYTLLQVQNTVRGLYTKLKISGSRGRRQMYRTRFELCLKAKNLRLLGPAVNLSCLEYLSHGRYLTPREKQVLEIIYQMILEGREPHYQEVNRVLGYDENSGEYGKIIFGIYSRLEIEKGEDRLLRALKAAILSKEIEGDISCLTYRSEISLTMKQQEILGLVGLGQSKKLIAQELGISTKIVRSHLAALKRKLAVKEEVGEGIQLYLALIKAGIKNGYIPEARLRWLKSPLHEEEYLVLSAIARGIRSGAELTNETGINNGRLVALIKSIFLKLGVATIDEAVAFYGMFQDDIKSSVACGRKDAPRSVGAASAWRNEPDYLAAKLSQVLPEQIDGISFKRLKQMLTELKWKIELSDDDYGLVRAAMERADYKREDLKSVTFVIFIERLIERLESRMLTEQVINTAVKIYEQTQNDKIAIEFYEVMLKLLKVKGVDGRMFLGSREIYKAGRLVVALMDLGELGMAGAIQHFSDYASGYSRAQFSSELTEGINTARHNTNAKIKSIIRKYAEEVRQGNFALALEDLRKITGLASDNIQVKYLLGLAYAGLGDYPRAASIFSEILEANPQMENIYTGLASLYCLMGDYRQARKLIKKRLALDPKARFFIDASVINELFAGFQYLLYGRLEEALECFNHQLDSSNTNSLKMARKYRSIIFTEQERAMGIRHKVPSFDKDLAAAYNYLGEASLGRQELERAIRGFENSLNHNPLAEKARQNLIEARRRLEERAKGLGGFFGNVTSGQGKRIEQTIDSPEAKKDKLLEYTRGQLPGVDLQVKIYCLEAEVARAPPAFIHARIKDGALEIYISKECNRLFWGEFQTTELPIVYAAITAHEYAEVVLGKSHQKAIQDQGKVEDYQIIAERLETIQSRYSKQTTIIVNRLHQGIDRIHDLNNRIIRNPYFNLGIIFSVVILAAILILFQIKFPDKMAEFRVLAESLGYGGVFLVFLVNSLSMGYSGLTPLALGLVFYLGTTLNPWLVGALAGIGATIGQITGFAVGYSGVAAVKEIRKRRLSHWAHRWGTGKYKRWTGRTYRLSYRISKLSEGMTKQVINKVFTKLKSLIIWQASLIVFLIYLFGFPLGDISAIILGGLAAKFPQRHFFRKYFFFSLLGNIPRHIIYARYGMQVFDTLKQPKILIPLVAGLLGIIALVSIGVSRRQNISRASLELKGLLRLKKRSGNQVRNSGGAQKKGQKPDWRREGPGTPPLNSRDFSQFAEGEFVNHKHFGPGQIVECSIRGSEEMIKIKFALLDEPRVFLLNIAATLFRPSTQEEFKALLDDPKVREVLSKINVLLSPYRINRKQVRFKTGQRSLESWLVKHPKISQKIDALVEQIAYSGLRPEQIIYHLADHLSNIEPVGSGEEVSRAPRMPETIRRKSSPYGVDHHHTFKPHNWISTDGGLTYEQVADKYSPGTGPVHAEERRPQAAWPRGGIALEIDIPQEWYPNMVQEVGRLEPGQIKEAIAEGLTRENYRFLRVISSKMEIEIKEVELIKLSLAQEGVYYAVFCAEVKLSTGEVRRFGLDVVLNNSLNTDLEADYQNLKILNELQNKLGLKFVCLPYALEKVQFKKQTGQTVEVAFFAVEWLSDYTELHRDEYVNADAFYLLPNRLQAKTDWNHLFDRKDSAGIRKKIISLLTLIFLATYREDEGGLVVQRVSINRGDFMVRKREGDFDLCLITARELTRLDPREFIAYLLGQENLESVKKVVTREGLEKRDVTFRLYEDVAEIREGIANVLLGAYKEAFLSEGTSGLESAMKDLLDGCVSAGAQGKNSKSNDGNSSRRKRVAPGGTSPIANKGSVKIGGPLIYLISFIVGILLTVLISFTSFACASNPEPVVTLTTVAVTTTSSEDIRGFQKEHPNIKLIISPEVGNYYSIPLILTNLGQALEKASAASRSLDISLETAYACDYPDAASAWILYVTIGENHAFSYFPESEDLINVVVGLIEANPSYRYTTTAPTISPEIIKNREKQRFIAEGLAKRAQAVYEENKEIVSRWMAAKGIQNLDALVRNIQKLTYDISPEAPYVREYTEKILNGELSAECWDKSTIFMFGMDILNYRGGIIILRQDTGFHAIGWTDLDKNGKPFDAEGRLQGEETIELNLVEREFGDRDPLTDGPAVTFMIDNPSLWYALCIGQISSSAKESASALIGQLKDKDPGIRQGACQVLGAIGPAAEEALPALIEASKDEGYGVSEAARAALDKIDPTAELRFVEERRWIIVAVAGALLVLVNFRLIRLIFKSLRDKRHSIRLSKAAVSGRSSQTAGSADGPRGGAQEDGQKIDDSNNLLGREGRGLRKPTAGFVQERAGSQKIIIDIGTGNGKVLKVLADDKRNYVIGFERYADKCREAMTLTAGMPNVRIIHKRIQDWNPPGGYAGRVDLVYWIFPDPHELEYEGGKIIDKVCSFLKEGGEFVIVSELRLSLWAAATSPEGVLSGFLDRAIEKGLGIKTCSEQDADSLPEAVKASDWYRRFRMGSREEEDIIITTTDKFSVITLTTALSSGKKLSSEPLDTPMRLGVGDLGDSQEGDSNHLDDSLGISSRPKIGPRGGSALEKGQKTGVSPNSEYITITIAGFPLWIRLVPLGREICGKIYLKDRWIGDIIFDAEGNTITITGLGIYKETDRKNGYATQAVRLLRNRYRGYRFVAILARPETRSEEALIFWQKTFAKGLIEKIQDADGEIIASNPASAEAETAGSEIKQQLSGYGILSEATGSVSMTGIPLEEFIIKMKEWKALMIDKAKEIISAFGALDKETSRLENDVAADLILGGNV